ncbi:sodium channel protein type 4 subunit alpha B-like isoform X2 [Hippocampus comes]|uniref:sodium channel protein type 4 subunit alpha B-like isoform X2 n=1 Tax=Hippocampus comes TaxID=109280 RepID=UPI00094EC23D|nr:PREDICTED: sodium channel protein type 4 subunit alpha B-like isoform X2 [Hippocampus comes]
MRSKTTFWDFWGTKTEQVEIVRQAGQLKPLTTELKMLLGNRDLREQLQNSKMVSLLPPVGTEVFRKFTAGSLKEIQRRREVKEKERQKGKDDSVLVIEEQQNPTADLESGKPLPFIFGDPAPEFVNTPLEDLDPFYQSKKRFIVLDGQKVIHRFNADPACYLLSASNLMRTTAIKILLHSFFHAFILLTVLTNCVFMTMAEPPEWSKFAKSTFIAIYVFEVLVKVAARGFCVGQFTFLSDPWNWLDLIIISTAYLTEMVQAGIVSAFQVLPALKLISAIPDVKKALGALGQTVKKMAHVIVLSLVCLSVLAALALHNFMGHLQQKCVMMLPSNYSSEVSDYTQYINNPGNYYFLPGHNDALLCGNRSGAGMCPEGYMCLRAGPNPNYGFTNYDSFGWAFLALFRMMTQDFWENLLQLTLRSAGQAYAITFLVDIVLGSFCLCSLIVAVVARAFVEQKQAETAEAKRKSKEYALVLEALKDQEKVDGNSCLTEKQDSSAAACEDEQRPRSPCCRTFADIFLKWTCCNRCRAQQRLRRFVTDPFFDLFIVLCIVLNVIFMAMEHFPMMQEFEELLSIAGLVFTAIFAVEVVLKFLAMGPYLFFQVGWNVFDTIIAAVTVLELGLADISGLSILRLFCVMRVFRLARWWPTFNALLKLIGSSLGVVRNFTLLLAIITFTFSVIGMQLFGQDYKENVCRISKDCLLPRWHMVDFFHSFLVTFRILCGEWIETMWDCMEVAGQPGCLIFYLFVVVIGKLAVLSLFLALLIKSPHGARRTASAVEGQNNLRIALNRIRGAFIGIKSQVLGHTDKKTELKPQSGINLYPPVLGLKSDKVDQKEFLALTFVSSEESESEVKDLGSHQTSKSASQTSGNQDNDEEKDLQNGDSLVGTHKRDDQDTPAKCFCDQCYRCCPILNMDSCPSGLRTWLNLRRACVAVVEHKYFEAFITFVILLSSVALAVEDIHLEKRWLLKTILVYADQVFTFVFVLEMLLRWFAGGLKKYFSNPWCRLDFLVVLISLLSSTATILGIPQLEAIKSLRTVRPLRLLSRFDGAKVVVTTLFAAFPFILDVLLACLTLWLIFGIVGVNMFAGKFFYCINATYQDVFHTQDINNKTDCIYLIEENFTEVRWKNSPINFDNVGIAYLSLLQVATFKGWMDIMYSAMDSKWVDSQPEYEANAYMIIYFIIFIIFGSFFTFNFLIGAIFEHLKQHKAKLGAIGLFMTEEQMKLYNSLKTLSCKKPRVTIPRPQNKIRGLLFDLVTKDAFDIFFMVFACVQVVVMMVETWDQSPEKDFILHWIHFAIILLFTAEFVLKVTALGRHYFAFGWNIFDFVLVILFILGLFLSDLLEKYFLYSPAVFSVIRLTRVCRIIHLFRVAKGARKLLRVLMRSLPALFNIGLFHFVIMFTFSVFGMKYFAYVKKGGMIDDVFNFETFGSSIISLFAITTTAGWDGLLHNTMQKPPDCNPYKENAGSPVRGDCSSPAVGIVFFTSYVILSVLVAVIMYIVVILENFNMAAEGSADELREADFEMFCETWEKFDPKGSRFIHSSQLSDFCDDLKEPLRIAKPNTIKVISMDLPLASGDKIHCLDLLVALTAQVQGISGEMDKLKARMEKRLKARSPSKVMDSYEPISSTLKRKREDVAATVIQRAYRKHAGQSPVKVGEAARPGGIPQDGDEEQ